MLEFKEGAVMPLLTNKKELPNNKKRG